MCAMRVFPFAVLVLPGTSIPTNIFTGWGDNLNLSAEPTNPAHTQSIMSIHYDVLRHTREVEAGTDGLGTTLHFRGENS